MANNIKKILLTGGGTGGSVMPLLAIVDEIRNLEHEISEINFLWLGTGKGPERQMVEKENIKFKNIANGKLRRYFSLWNFIDLFLIITGFWQAFFIMLKWRPDLVISAGSFVSVPAVWAAWILRIPVLIHQQDVRSGLANRLMLPFAKIITVTFAKSLKDYGQKAVWIGNPVRSKIGNVKLEIREIKKKFSLKNNIPIVLIIGGGTGALAINKLVEQSAKELVEFCQVIHITGKGKSTNNKLKIENYKNYEFLNTHQIAEVFETADIVVSRCGMGALTELSYLGKPAILIPIPGSHQEENAQVFKEKEAAIILNQSEVTVETFIAAIKRLINDKELRNKLRNKIKEVMKSGANREIIRIIKKRIN